MRTADVEVDHDGIIRLCDILAIPLSGRSTSRDCLYLVLFEEPAPGSTPGSPATAALAGGPVCRRRPKLEWERSATKRDLQSIGKELIAVNDELQARNQYITVANGDLVDLLASVDIPIIVLDRERKIRRYTPRARSILNVVVSDIGRPLEDIRPNIDALDLDGQIREVIATARGKESEVRDRDGRWHRLQIRPYTRSDKRVDGAVVCLFDIDTLKHHVTDAQLANANADRANQTKDDFLATLSHELRTPLSSMLMRAQLLRGGGMDDAKVRRAGESIEAGVKKQVQLINDLLDVSRIVTGKLNLEMQPVDLARTVTAAVEAMAPAIERKSLKVDVDVPPGRSRRKVYGDDSRLQQVVTNLVANAIKFTPERGNISVSLVASGEIAIIRVKDTGMGIDSGFLPVVFDRFVQANSTSTRAYGGLGLGLAIVRHLVELHHGTVLAESDGVGLGSTFSITLPLMKAERISPPAGARPSLMMSNIDGETLRGLRLLVVDDDLATREAMADMLERTGAEVRLAESSADAMKMIHDFRPDVLLCDVAMPGEDGYAFIQRLRALGVSQFGRVPALALTALAHDDDRDRALAAGYQMHMAKPADIEHLTQAILDLAASRGSSPTGAAG